MRGQRRPAPRDHRRAAARHRARQPGSTCSPSGLDRFDAALDDDLATVPRGGAAFKAVRGEYGSGKTFFARWLAERAKRRGLRHRRGPDLRDRDPAAPAGDGLPPAHRAAAHRRRSRERACGRSSTPGSSPWRRTCSPTARSPTTTRRRSAAAVDAAAGAAARPRSRRTHPGVRRGAARLPAGARRRRRRHRRRADRLARRPAARRRRGASGPPGSRATSTTSAP